MLIGYCCYNKDGEPLGWLYTYNNDIELVATNKYLSWCKRWKTERGAKKSFEHYNSRWQTKSKGGYLKIELMPDIAPPESAESRRQRLLEQWGDDITNALPNNGSNLQFLSFHPQPEILQWLSSERNLDENGELESDDTLINRKLKKLRKLEQQGF